MDRHEEFLKLLLRNEAELRAFVRSVVRDRQICEDLLQDVALTLWQKFEAYDPARPFGAWARGIAVNKVLQSREKSRRIPMPFSPEAVLAVREAYDRCEAGASAERDALHECLGQLPAGSRRLLALRYEQSLELRRIAETEKSTLDAVHKALSRIRAALRRCIELRTASAQAGS